MNDFDINIDELERVIQSYNDLEFIFRNNGKLISLPTQGRCIYHNDKDKVTYRLKHMDDGLLENGFTTNYYRNPLYSSSISGFVRGY